MGFDWGLDALLAQEQFVSFLEDTRWVGTAAQEYSHEYCGPGGSTHTSTVAQEGVLTRVLAWCRACLSFLVAHERSRAAGFLQHSSVAIFRASLQHFTPRCNVLRLVATFCASRGAGGGGTLSTQSTRREHAESHP